MDLLRPGPQLLLGEPVEGLAHEGEVGIESSVALYPAQSGEERRIAVVGHERRRRVEPVPRRPPRRFPSHRARRQVGEHVGHECAGDPGLVVARAAVPHGGPGGPHPRRRVGQVVGQHLLHLDVTGGGQPPRRSRHDRGGELDGVVGATEVGRHRIGHGPGGYRGFDPASGTRPTTVTSGGRTTESSPGETPVRSPR